MCIYLSINQLATASNEHEQNFSSFGWSSCGPVDRALISDRRARVRGSPGETPPCTLMAPGACKIRRGEMSFKFPFKTTSLRVPKCQSHPLCCESKLCWYVSRSSLGMGPRRSAKAHCVALARR